MWQLWWGKRLSWIELGRLGQTWLRLIWVSVLERIVRARGTITGFAVLTLLWSASNVFNVLTQAADRVWAVDEK